jgi:hypothetical protein
MRYYSAILYLWGILVQWVRVSVLHMRHTVCGDCGKEAQLTETIINR